MVNFSVIPLEIKAFIQRISHYSLLCLTIPLSRSVIKFDGQIYEFNRFTIDEQAYEEQFISDIRAKFKAPNNIDKMNKKKIRMNNINHIQQATISTPLFVCVLLRMCVS